MLLVAAAFAFDVTTPACVGARLTFTATEPEAQSWSWTVNGVPAGDEESFEWVFQDVGTYPVSLEMDTADGPKTESADVEVYRVPEVTLGGPVDLFAHDHADYLATANEPLTWAWTATGGTLLGDATADAVTVEWGETTPGTIEVAGTAADSPCAGVQSLTVKISAPVGDSGGGDTGEATEPGCGCAAGAAGGGAAGLAGAVGVAAALGRRRRR